MCASHRSAVLVIGAAVLTPCFYFGKPLILCRTETCGVSSGAPDGRYRHRVWCGVHCFFYPAKLTFPSKSDTIGTGNN